MVRDLFPAGDSQRIMSMVTLWFGLAPAIAPMLGGYLYAHLGWHSIFWFTAIFCTVDRDEFYAFHETHPPELRQPFRMAPLLAGYKGSGCQSNPFLFCRLPPRSISMGSFSIFFLRRCFAPLETRADGYSWLFVCQHRGIMTGAFISVVWRAGGRGQDRAAAKHDHDTGGGTEPRARTRRFALRSWSIIPIYLYAAGTATAFPSCRSW